MREALSVMMANSSINKFLRLIFIIFAASEIRFALFTLILFFLFRTLFCNFSRSGADLGSAFAALNMAMATWISTNVRGK